MHASKLLIGWLEFNGALSIGLENNWDRSYKAKTKDCKIPVSSSLHSKTAALRTTSLVWILLQESVLNSHMLQQYFSKTEVMQWQHF